MVLNRAVVYKIKVGNAFSSNAFHGEFKVLESHGRIEAKEVKNGYQIDISLAPEDRVFGLGESTGSMNKRGRVIVSFNSDNGRHEDDTYSLYSSHNFLLIDGVRPLGLFFDSASRLIFDIGHGDKSLLSVKSDKGVDVYLIEGDDPLSITREFLSHLQTSYVPPLWGLGYGQSRFSYFSEKEVKKVARKYRRHNLPLDYICLDIHYMDKFEDFTFTSSRFPDPKGMGDSLLELYGVHIVPIVDAGIKIAPGSKAYEEGISGGYFCLKEDNTPFKAAVWPGYTHFVDFLKPGASDYFGRLFDFYEERGMSGYWLDMNEPSIFHSELTEKAPKSQKKESGDPYWEGNGFLSDYKSFYHYSESGPINHYDVHNLYGGLLSKAVYEHLCSKNGKRPMIFGRSTYIGSHCYGGIWTGDNHSDFAHLSLNVHMMPGLNMAGFLFSGADTGGFGGDCDRELALRWHQFSLFTPLFRNHSAIFTRRQECYSYRGKRDFRTVLSARYRLLPYLYSELLKCALNHDMLIKPLEFVFHDDKAAKGIEDELIVGDSILICPVLERGAKGRDVYLPVDMTLVRFDGKEFSLTPWQKGKRYLPYSKKEVCFFLLPGKSFIAGKPVLCAKDIDLHDVTLFGEGPYMQYLDDGESLDIASCEKREIKPDK